METKPRNTKTPARVDTTLSQAILNLSIGVPAIFALYLVAGSISENKKFENDLKLSDKQFKIESLKIVNAQPYEAMIFKQRIINDSLLKTTKSQMIDNQLLQIENKIKDVKVEQYKNALK